MRPHRPICGVVDRTRSTSQSFIVAFGAVVALFFGAAALQAKDDVSDLLQRARNNFKPVSDKELADARAELRERMKEVADFVRPSSENGKRWLRYLHWDALKQAAAE